jgi:NAD(P)-dependent dehydrogenase (short-subunit alcohol dehydrogenase family)
LETTILFLREGASVLMTDVSEAGLSKAMAKAKELAPQMTGQVDIMKCDVTKETDIMACVDRVDEWGGVDVMFNNAGIMHGQDDGKPDLHRWMI